ncbi:dynein regulatory complex protein 10 [Pempheris klunzingeri]|uniref:dynein regulatory complex protein 10 n=1 Tax=Pempheris klunzingeri TaxID=3127111 RepID=UPI00398190A8
MDKGSCGALQDYQMLEILETLEGLKRESHGEQDREVGEARKRERDELKRDIKKSIRDLLRFARADPVTIFGLMAEQVVEVEESEYKLITELRKFHGHMVDKMLTSADEELELSFFTSLPLSRVSKHIVSKDERLTAHIKDLDAMISLTNDEIKYLLSLLEEKHIQEAHTSLLSHKQCQSRIKTSNVKQSGIQLEIDQLNIQLNNFILENRQAERVLQEKNEKVEIQIEYLLQNFDDEIRESQANLELNTMGYEREEEELRKLEKPFSVLDAECNQIQERRRLAEEKRKEEMMELELKTKAAIFAQAWWRGYRTRKALKNKSKNKAKKGKGKKPK